MYSKSTIEIDLISLKSKSPNKKRTFARKEQSVAKKASPQNNYKALIESLLQKPKLS